jgi:hypothetical protein
MIRWFFPRRRARRAYLDACIQAMLEEAALARQTISLGRAAFRLQRLAADGGVFVSFEQAFYCLRKRDQKEVFRR